MASLPRFFVKNEDIKREKFVFVDPQMADKLRHVLRLNKGSKINLIDEDGNLYEAQLTTISREKIMGDLLNKKTPPKRSKPVIILAQALPKAGKIDEIVKDNTQLGIDAFIFFESEYGVVKLAKVKDSKIERLNRIAHESARQSERLTIPSIENLMTFEDMCKLDIETKILLHSRKTKDSIDIDEFKKSIDEKSEILLAVGPEGGFSDKELGLAQRNDFKIIHMNLPILRTEIAGFAACSILLS